MRSDSFTAQVLGNVARTVPPFSAPDTPISGKVAGFAPVRAFRSWLLHALAFAPLGDDTSGRDAMRMSPRAAGTPVRQYARQAPRHTPAPASKPSTPESAVTPSATSQLAIAHRWLEAANGMESPLQQYVAVHRAALSAASAVLTVRQRPEHRLGRRSRVRSTWDLLADVMPEFAEFAAYFEKTTIKMIRAEAGIAGAVGPHELADLRLHTMRFMSRVEVLKDVQEVVAAPPDNSGGSTAIRRTS